MSRGELERVEVMGRVAKEKLKLIDAAAMLQLSYRQVKRLWRRYQEKGSKGLQHGHVGRVSNRSKPAKFRRRVLSLIRQKYSGSERERFGPTLASEHLASEDHVEVHRRPCVGGCWRRGCGAGRGSGGSIGSGGRRGSILGNWYRWTAASIGGSSNAGRQAA